MDFAWRRCIVDDEAIAYALVCELEEKQLDEAWFHEAWLDNLKDPSRQYYVASMNGVICGFASFVITKPLHHTDLVGEVEEFVVKQEYRRQGVGNFMFKKLIEEAQNRNVRLFELSSRDTRTQAHVFYRKQGMNMRHYKFTLNI